MVKISLFCTPCQASCFIFPAPLPTTTAPTTTELPTSALTTVQTTLLTTTIMHTTTLTNNPANLTTVSLNTSETSSQFPTESSQTISLKGSETIVDSTTELQSTRKTENNNQLALGITFLIIITIVVVTSAYMYIKPYPYIFYGTCSWFGLPLHNQRNLLTTAGVPHPILDEISPITSYSSKINISLLFGKEYETAATVDLKPDDKKLPPQADETDTLPPVILTHSNAKVMPLKSAIGSAKSLNVVTKTETAEILKEQTDDEQQPSQFEHTDTVQPKMLMHSYTKVVPLNPSISTKQSLSVCAKPKKRKRRNIVSSPALQHQEELPAGTGGTSASSPSIQPVSDGKLQNHFSHGYSLYQQSQAAQPLSYNQYQPVAHHYVPSLSVQQYDFPGLPHDVDYLTQFGTRERQWNDPRHLLPTQQSAKSLSTMSRHSRTSLRPKFSKKGINKERGLSGHNISMIRMQRGESMTTHKLGQ